MRTDPGTPHAQGAGRACLALAAVVLALLFAAGPGKVALAGPAAELWPRWTTHDPGSRATIDHSAWAGFLSRHLVRGEDGITRIRYGAVDASDRDALNAYLEGLVALPISTYRRDEQLAYWANLYNALTVRVMLDHYPVESIRDINISPGLFSRGPWGRKLVSVEGEPLSLDDIEHRIMRPIWQDPRIHYMVNCAALGCPNLLPRPFTADRLNAMMDMAARDFVNHPRGARFEDGRLHVSSIYHWYRTDFGDSDEGVIAHLAAHADGDLARDLRSASRIHGHRYDWALNEAPPGG